MYTVDMMIYSTMSINQSRSGPMFFQYVLKCMMCLDGFPYSWTHYGPDIEGMKIVRHPWFQRNIPGMKVLCVGVGSRQWRK